MQDEIDHACRFIAASRGMFEHLVIGLELLFNSFLGA